MLSIAFCTSCVIFAGMKKRGLPGASFNRNYSSVMFSGFFACLPFLRFKQDKGCMLCANAAAIITRNGNADALSRLYYE